MADAVGKTRKAVEALLKENVGEFAVQQDGSFAFAYESIMVLVRIDPYFEGALVILTAPTNYEVPGTPELFEFVATNDPLIGGITAVAEEGGYTIVIAQALLGKSGAGWSDAGLNWDEFKFVLSAIANEANDVDEAIQKQFGGKLLSEL